MSDFQPKQKVLAIDDEPTNLKILGLILGDQCELTLAGSGEEGLKKASELKPDLILLDIMMPGMDGYEVCKRIKADPSLRLTKVVLISGKIMIEDRLKGYELGADDYLTKPFIAEELEAKAKVFLRLVQSEARHLNALREVGLVSEELLQAKNTLAHGSQLSAIGEIAGTITGEVKNPLTIMGVINDQIKKAVEESPPNVPVALKMIEKSQVVIARVSGLIRSVSALTRDGRADPVEECSVTAIFEEILGVFRPHFKQKSVRLDYAPLFSPVLLECQPTQIHQMVMALLHNSLHAVASLEGPWVNIQLTSLNFGVEIVITDSGSGLTERTRQELAKIFTTKQTVTPGTHGLSAVSQIVRFHGGSIGVDADCPNTRFRIFLPLKHVSV